ncbi:MAG: tyrosine-type recombinase/integrase [Candidatus Dojkabacteria bacterium]|nr:tyrosine-type recombinase/integrase [Candidatus Dojkabacteria bacterium]
MRIGEMCTLMWHDIDFNNKTIHVQRSNKNGGEIGSTKNGKTRKVDMLPPVEKVLRNQFNETGLKEDSYS